MCIRDRSDSGSVLSKRSILKNYMDEINVCAHCVVVTNAIVNKDAGFHKKLAGKNLAA